MSEAADGAAGVTALVYVASFNLEGGESTAQLAAKFPGGELGPALDSVPFPLADGETGVDLYIQQDRFREVFAADVAPEVAELMAAPADSMRPNRRPLRADPARSDRHLRVRDLGCADAIRRDFDVVGIAILAVITALGGGILRDFILGDAPPPPEVDTEGVMRRRHR